MFKQPVVEYVRPYGHRHEDILELPELPGLEAGSLLLAQLGIEVTLEDMQRMINVCFDDGDFDYRFFLFSREELARRVAEEIAAFNEEDYLEEKERSGL